MKVRRQFRIAAAALALSMLAGCAKKNEPAAPAPQTVSGVQLVSASAAKVPDAVELVGTVRARESATLSAEVMGRIASIAAREGDHVRAGQTLITLHAAQLGAQAAQAEAAVAATGQQVAAAESEAALAQSTLKRYELLQEQKSVSPQEYDEVATRARAAEARLAALRQQERAAQSGASAARTMQGYTRIAAPFDGVVTARMADPGALAGPGVPLLTVERAGALRLEVSVDESLLPLVHVGAAIPVALDSLSGAALEGKVAEIVPAADPGSRSFVVKIDLPRAAGLHSGVFGRASLVRGSKDVVLVPRSAVVAHGSLESVYVVGADSIAQLRYVATGAVQDSQIVVLSGLSAGERIVASPGEQELGGKRIESAGSGAAQ